MIDAKQAIQLIKNNWTDPSALARELYTAATSRAPRTLQAPLTIEVPAGRTALRIVQSPAAPPTQKSPRAELPPPQRQSPRPAQADSRPQSRPTPEYEARQAARTAEQHRIQQAAIAKQADHTFTGVPPRSDVRQSAISVAADSAKALTAARASTFVGPPELSAVTQRPAELPSPARAQQPTARPQQARQDTTTPATSLVKATPAAQSQVSPATVLAVPRAARTDVASYAPYAAPVIEVNGPASFRGAEPVQFEAPPTIFDPGRRQYQPIQDWVREELTRIPGQEYSLSAFVGQVIKGTGETWRVTVYPLGPDFASSAFDADVTCKGIGKNYAAPADAWIGPILEFPDPAGGNFRYFYFPPTFLGGRIAKAPSGITEMSSGVPGSGDVDVYTFDGKALKVDYKAKAYNLSSTAVGANKWLLVLPIEGRLFVDFEDCQS